MKNRREFLNSAVSIGIGGIVSQPALMAVAQTHTGPTRERNERNYWLAVLEKLAMPIIENLAQHQLKKAMPVEAASPAERSRFTHLEAFGRLMCGIAPWLAATGLDELENKRQQNVLKLVRASLDAATDPTSPDFMNFTQGSQPLVDAAFLAQGILSGRQVLYEPLEARLRRQLIDALKSSRFIPTPTSNNWVMFAAMIEAALHAMGENTIEDRFEACVRRMLDWYKGDGSYGDGEFLHFDYYNSFVIHPMLLDVLAVLRKKDHQFEAIYATELRRARRYAEILERLIAPDGTFPAIGRSITYRFGALHALAQIALMRELPEHITPAQVRSAMTAVIRKLIEAPSTFDDSGWLRIGFYGHQPSLAESYISTGSLYLCAAALLPLGLAPSDPFWSTPDEPWTSQRIWSGEPGPADHAISDSH